METQQIDLDLEVLGSYFADDADAPATWEEALRTLGAAFVEHGCATPEYTEAAVTRERAFPTGLDLGAWAVALPHGDPIGVLHGAISVGRFERPVRFRRMDDAEREVEVEAVFFMAVDDPERHLAVLSKLMEVIGSGSCRREMLVAYDGEAIANVVKQQLERF